MKNLISIFRAKLEKLLPVSNIQDYYLNYLNFIIFDAIKSRGIPGLSLIFGNLLLDRNDKLLVDKTTIESVLDKLILEHKENAEKVLNTGTTVDSDLEALFLKRASNILTPKANNEEDSNRTEVTYFSPARVSLLLAGSNPVLLNKLEDDSRKINSEIDSLYEAYGTEFKIVFGRLLEEAYFVLYLELYTADSDFAFVRAVVGHNILVIYLSEIPFGSKFCCMAYSAVPLLRYLGKDGGGSSEFDKNNNSIFQKLGPALGWEPELYNAPDRVSFFYRSSVYLLILVEIKSRGIPQGLSLIFGNYLLDKDDNLIVDQTRIESVLDKSISELIKVSIKFPKDSKFFERNDFVASFRQRPNDILDLLAKNQKYPEKIGGARVHLPSWNPMKSPPFHEQQSQIP